MCNEAHRFVDCSKRNSVHSLSLSPVTITIPIWGWFKPFTSILICLRLFNQRERNKYFLFTSSNINMHKFHFRSFICEHWPREREKANIVSYSPKWSIDFWLCMCFCFNSFNWIASFFFSLAVSENQFVTVVHLCECHMYAFCVGYFAIGSIAMPISR